MAFVLFLLVNAALFLRPAEILPEWESVSVYEYLIIGCFVLAVPEILAYLMGGSLAPRGLADSPSGLETQPITLCVFGVLAAVVLAQMPTFNLGEAWRTGFYLFKVVVYYLLFVSLVNTPARLRIFIAWLVWCSAGLTLITVLQYHEIITLPNVKRLTEAELNPITGEVHDVGRMQATGLFNDPNELGVMLATVVPLTLYLVTDPRTPLAFVYALPLGLFVYAIAATLSRGAFLALLAGLAGLTAARFGMRRTVLLGGLALPVLFVLFAGRQTDLSTMQGTGQSRIQIWSDWLGDFRASPLFGQGMSLEPEGEDLKERAAWEGKKHVAHNSYLHSFRDLGIVGGMFFLGAFVLAFWVLLRLDPRRTRIVNPGMGRLRPFVIGALSAFAVGILSLSLCYGVPTYLVLGLVVAYERTTPYYPRLRPLRWDLHVAGRLALASVGFLGLTYLLVRVFANFG